LVKKSKRKFPKSVLEPLMDMCELDSEYTEESATELFKWYLSLMDKFADYFFKGEWPKKYDYEYATTFTDEDLEFLYGHDRDAYERFETVCLKKNISLEGFLGHFGMYWTRQAFYEKFVKPELKPVLEAFERFSGDEDARDVLNELKKEFSDMYLIHLSLTDIAEHQPLDKAKDLLVARMLELIHTEEDFGDCGNYACELTREGLKETSDKT